MNTLASVALSCLVLALSAGCRSAYYSTLEAFGQHKRDLLVERVQDAREEQEEAREQFKDALERFSEVTKFEGGDLRRAYDQLESEYEKSHSEAEDVSERIRSIEQVADDLFDEWKEELGEYESDELRRASEEQLRQTRERYDELREAMVRAETSMEPVLSALHDHVLFLKHNLNAQAVASLQGNIAALEKDIGLLLERMDAAIREADAFIAAMGEP